MRPVINAIKGLSRSLGKGKGWASPHWGIDAGSSCIKYRRSDFLKEMVVVKESVTIRKDFQTTVYQSFKKS